MRCQHAKGLVRVDPPVSRTRDRLGALERQAGGVREQVPDRRAGRAGGLVEVDHALLGGDHRRERRHGLRHGGEPNDARGVASGRHGTGRIDDSRGGELGRPVVDLAKCLHARAILVASWSDETSPGRARTSRSWATRARSSSAIGCTSRARPRTRPTAPRRPRTSTTRRTCASSSSARRSSRREPASPTSCARASIS